MARQQKKDHSDPTAAAIERVLKVERDAAEQLQHSRELAQQLLSQARDQAAALAKRADTRISALHTAYLQKVQRDIDSLVRSNLPSGEQPDRSYDRERLVEAARRIAAKLTSGA